MTRKEIINGLKMSMDLTLFDPSTGEVMEPWQLNEVNRTAYEAYKGAIELLEEMPSAQPDTTTHDSIPAETGKNDGDGTSGDCISRQQAIEAVEKSMYENPHENAILRGMHDHEHKHFLVILMGLPSAQPSDDYERGWHDGREALREEMWEDDRDRLDQQTAGY